MRKFYKRFNGRKLGHLSYLENFYNVCTTTFIYYVKIKKS